METLRCLKSLVRRFGMGFQGIDPDHSSPPRASRLHGRGWLLAAILAGLSVVGVGYWLAPSTIRTSVASSASISESSAADRHVIAYRTASCGCCKGWLDHLRTEGFSVEDHVVADLETIKRNLKVPADLASCHTATVAGYAIEGHVPAKAIELLQQQRPAVAGIAVPGMPLGSPGMESSLGSESYTVFSFGSDGSHRPFLQIPV